ncbi:HD domain-containing protein [Streptacidiphilus anmyonensis]|uniref:HD domain-containing protein n=1 Tax=Streptacidiphilus anmyonensis TaxID=405782 RepID=UPI0005A7F5DC|nr:HD domain-containing protein [Streptacidiphilus anmyonensis]
MPESSSHPDQNLAEGLLTRWTALFAAPEAEPYGAQLLRRWSEPQRKYHTLRHLAATLQVVDRLAGHADDADLVRLAAWFHDAIYAPDRSENEERSARLAEKVLPELGVSDEAIAEVARLVRLTATHDPAPGDRNGEVLCDADLAILGAPPQVYAGYTAAVRAEYAFVPEEDFRTGRAAILEQLLAKKPSLYRTQPAQATFGPRAEANLRSELARLRDKVPPVT